VVMPITEHSIRHSITTDCCVQLASRTKEGSGTNFLYIHDFGKYFKTKAELAEVKPTVEMLMGHSLGRVIDSYLKPSENELLNEYRKASDALSINAPQKLKLEVERLQAGISELEDKNRRIEELERKQTQSGLHSVAIWINNLHSLGKR
jgi:hypothetical protein